MFINHCLCSSEFDPLCHHAALFNIYNFIQLMLKAVCPSELVLWSFLVSELLLWWLHAAGVQTLRVFVQLCGCFVSLCLSGTVINSRVFSPQTVHLQKQLLSAVVSGDGESAPDWVGVIDWRTAVFYKCDPLQSFSRSLSDPAHSKAAECESRGCTGQSVRFSRTFNHWFRLCQSLTINTWKRDEKKWIQMLNPFTALMV